MNLDKLQIKTLPYDKCAKATLRMVLKRLVLQPSELSWSGSSSMKNHILYHSSGGYYGDYDLTVVRYGKKAIAAGISFKTRYELSDTIYTYVNPKFRRKGVGSTMLRHMVSHRMKSGANQLRVVPWDDLSTAFYTGFQERFVEPIKAQLS